MKKTTNTKKDKKTMTNAKEAAKACDKHACKCAGGAELPADLKGIIERANDPIDAVFGVLGWFLDACVSAAKGGQPAKGGMNESHANLVKTVLRLSRYDMGGYEIAARRNESLDTPNVLGFDIFVGKTVKDQDGERSTLTEMFPARFYRDSFERTVMEFDKSVANLRYLRPPVADKPISRDEYDAIKEKIALKPAVKPAKRPCNGNLNKRAHPCKEQGKATCPVDKKTMVKMPISLSEIKKNILLHTAFRVPVKRFRIVADRVDRKSQKIVYELRFFQKDPTKHKDQPYETAPLRIKLGGDDWTSVAKRFDKAVGGLKFNSFERK